MKAASGSSSTTKELELGSYQGTCFRVVDLGTQKDSYENGPEFEEARIMIFWELSEKMDDGRPFAFSREYRISMGEKTNLRKDFENWTGVKLTQGMVDKFEADPASQLRRLLGKCCIVSIGLSRNNKKKVTGVLKMLPGMECLPPVNPQVFFDLSVFDQAAFDGLPDFVKAKIRTSPEYQALQKPQPAPVDPAKASDDIPF